MTADEILDCAAAESLGYGTVVLQSGEDPGLDEGWIGRAGAPDQDRDTAGRDAQPGRAARRRYCPLARGRGRPLPAAVRDLEPRLFRSIHPAARRASRSAGSSSCVILRRLGYEVGSGVMIGIPGQTYDDLADDIELFRPLDLDMIGVGPYLPHPDTPLADPERWRRCRTASKCRPTS